MSNKTNAVYKGNLILDKKTGRMFNDIIHYFNEDMGELYYISFAYTKHERKFEFTPPRVWSKEILADYKIERI